MTLPGRYRVRPSRKREGSDLSAFVFHIVLDLLKYYRTLTRAFKTRALGTPLLHSRIGLVLERLVF